nr:IS110 family transposase [Paenibacillus sp. ISL-20]
MAANLPEVELVKSIPGIGTKLAAAIVAEVGDVKQFSDAKQLVAYAGLDPGIFSSGKFTAKKLIIMLLQNAVKILNLNNG